MRRFSFLVVLFGVLATPAFAHPAGSTGSFAAGLAHPLGGADHLAAIALAGLWSVLVGRTATVAWPGTFVAAMLGGFAAASAGLQISFAETIVGFSVMLLGAFIAFELRMSVMLGAAVVGPFAFFHGYVHGTQATTSMLVPYAAGFTVATVVILAVAMAATAWAKGSAGRLLVRAAAGSAALAGLLLLRSVP
jgi:urease accessory protein